MPLNGRNFSTERPETKPASFACTHAKRRNESEGRWIRRTTNDRLPPGADERDRAMVPKLRDSLIRFDDVIVCESCRWRFGIPTQPSLVFLPSER